MLRKQGIKRIIVNRRSAKPSRRLLLPRYCLLSTPTTNYTSLTEIISNISWLIRGGLHKN